jgi:hypothetical protein
VWVERPSHSSAPAIGSIPNGHLSDPCEAQGVKLGNPRASETVARAHAANRATADQFAANILPIVRTIQASGITSLVGIAQALNARGVRTARGGAWHASTVKNLLGRTVRFEPNRPSRLLS